MAHMTSFDMFVWQVLVSPLTHPWLFGAGVLFATAFAVIGIRKAWRKFGAAKGKN